MQVRSPTWMDRVPSFLLPLLTATGSPAFWGMIWLAATKSLEFLLVALVFSQILYQALQAAYYRYYQAQARQAQKALDDSLRRYSAEVMPLGEFIDVSELSVDRSIDPRALWVVVLEKLKPGTPTFLNFRAYLQPGTPGNSLVLLSRGSRAQDFYILHELGHLTKTSHYHALFGQSPVTRLGLIGGLLIVLSPTWTVAGLIVLYVAGERFLHGAIRREYLADSFAWSLLASSKPDWRERARSISAAFKAQARLNKNFEVGLELTERIRLCDMVAAAQPGRGEKMVRGDGLAKIGTGLYAMFCRLVELAATIAMVLQFDGAGIGIAAFLFLSLCASTAALQFERSKPEMYRLDARLNLMASMRGG